MTEHTTENGLKCAWCGTPALVCPDPTTDECCCLPCYERGHGIEGRSDPTGGDGYLPRAWDEVRSAYLDGHISASAYDALRAHIIPPEEPTR